jgi:hypothetical protein
VSTNRLAELDTELGLIQQKLDEIAAMPEPDGDEAVRSQALTDRATETDDLIARWDELTEERKPLMARAQKLADVKAAAQNMARLEPGDGARYLGGVGPGFNRQVDPFEGDLLRLPVEEVVTRSRRLIETEKRVRVSDASRERLDGWVQRSVDDDDADPDNGFDGGYIARRMLLTERPIYRAAFRKYVAGRDAFAYTAEEQAAIGDFARFERFEIRRALSENTTTAGGFGIPVKLAA